MIYVGIDIGKNSHHVSIINEEGVPVLKSFTIHNTREELNLFVQKLSSLSFEKKDFLIGMEATGHYWYNIYHNLTLLNYKIYVINPIQSDALRNMYIRKTKSDSTDARLIAQLVRLGKFTETSVQDSELLFLRNLCRHHFFLVDSAADLKRKLKSLLDVVFPEFETLFSETFSKTSLTLLMKYPSPQELSKADISEIQELIVKSSRGHYGYAKAMEIKKTAENTFGTDSAGSSFMINLISQQIEFLAGQIKEIDKKIEEKFKLYDTFLTTIPGISIITGATILSESGNISRFSNSKQYGAFAGLDPTTYQSGKFTGDKNHMSKRGSVYLRRAFWLAAFVAVTKNQKFIELYKKKINEGKNHQETIGYIAHKILTISFVVMKNKTPYRE